MPGSSSAAGVTAGPVAVVGGGAAAAEVAAEAVFGLLIHGASRLSSGALAVGAVFATGPLIPAFAAAAFCTCSSSCRADFSSSAAARLPEAARAQELSRACRKHRRRSAAPHPRHPAAALRPPLQRPQRAHRGHRRRRIVTCEGPASAEKSVAAVEPVTGRVERPQQAVALRPAVLGSCEKDQLAVRCAGLSGHRAVRRLQPVIPAAWE